MNLYLSLNTIFFTFRLSNKDICPLLLGITEIIFSKKCFVTIKGQCQVIMRINV